MQTLVKFAGAILTAGLAAWTANAGVGAWSSLPGPGDAAGIVNVIAGHPTDATLRYLATQGGMYVSRDAGGTWQLSNSGIAPTPAGYHGVTDMAVTDSLVYITPWFLQKSTNGGSAWVRTGWVTENPQALVLAVDTRNETTVYAGANQGVYKSSDAGATWKYLAGNSPVYALAVDPGNPAVLFRGVSSGIYRTQDAGLSWTQVNSQLSVHTFAFGSADSQTIYAGTTRTPSRPRPTGTASSTGPKPPTRRSSRATRRRRRSRATRRATTPAPTRTSVRSMASCTSMGRPSAACCTWEPRLSCCRSRRPPDTDVDQHLACGAAALRRCGPWLRWPREWAVVVDEPARLHSEQARRKAAAVRARTAR